MILSAPRRITGILVVVMAIALSAGCATLDTARASRISAIEEELLRIPADDPAFKVAIIGEVDGRGHRYPILAVEYRPPEGGTYTVLNMGGIHGDEAGGVEAVYRMMLECRASMPRDVNMDFILCANPWGYRFDRREDREGIDLNRDFSALKSLEARIIDDYLIGRKYDLVVDHHENKHADGYSIIIHDLENRPIARAVIDASPEYGVATRMQKVENYDGGISMIGVGSGKAFSQYAGLRLCSPKRTFVIETPTAWDMDKRVRCHLDIERKLEEALLR